MNNRCFGLGNTYNVPSVYRVLYIQNIAIPQDLPLVYHSLHFTREEAEVPTKHGQNSVEVTPQAWDSTLTFSPPY